MTLNRIYWHCVRCVGGGGRKERRGEDRKRAGAGNGLHWPSAASDEWRVWDGNMTSVRTQGGDPPIRCPVTGKHQTFGEGGAGNEWSPGATSWTWWHQDTLATGIRVISAILMKITPGQHLNTRIVMSPALPGLCLQSVLQVIISQRNVMPRTRHPWSDLPSQPARPDLRS